MSWVLVAIIIAVGLLLSGLFSGSEIGLYRLNRLRLQLARQQNDPAAGKLEKWVKDEQSALSAILISNNVMNYATTSAVAFLFAELLRLGDVDAQIYTMVLVTPTVFVFGEVVPKNLFHRHADTLMKRVVWVLLPAQWMLRVSGAIWLLNRIADLLNRLVGSTVADPNLIAPKRRVAAMLQEALAGEKHGEWQADVIDRVVLLSETPLRAIMIPARSVAVIAASANRAELIRIARETGFARLPVHGRQRTEITGLVKIDDLLRRDDWTQVGQCAEPASQLQPGETVLTAITRLRLERQEAAIITNAAGRMIGLTTLRDLLQEVVGEGAPA